MNKKLVLALTSTIVVVVSLSLYLVDTYYLTPQLSASETAERYTSVMAITSDILAKVGKDLQDFDQNIINSTTFRNNILQHRLNLTLIKENLLGIQNIMYPSYKESIDLLQIGLQIYIDALDYTYELEFDLSSYYLVVGTDYILKSKETLP